MVKGGITPTTWLSDNEFIGTRTNVRRFRDPGDGMIHEQEVHTAIYGWSKNGKSFMVYTVSEGHIMKIGTIKRDALLDFRSVTV